MGNPGVATFELVEWVEEEPGVRVKAMTLGESRWAIVEYRPSAGRAEWCTEGHHGYVVEGAMHYEFDDGTPPLRATAGQGFVLPAGQGHRGFNHHPQVTRLLIIDDPA